MQEKLLLIHLFLSNFVCLASAWDFGQKLSNFSAPDRWKLPMLLISYRKQPKATSFIFPNFVSNSRLRWKVELLIKICLQDIRTQLIQREIKFRKNFSNIDFLKSKRPFNALCSRWNISKLIVYVFLIVISNLFV